MKNTRLDKFLSENTDYTRSELKKLIRIGKASVNGETVKAPDFKIDEKADSVVFCGKKIEYKKFVYLLINKPAGIISASDDKSRETVVDIVPDQYKHYELFPVGRLDKDTTGLLLITNDGEYAHKVISPKSSVQKSYIVKVDDTVKPDIIEKFEQGIVLTDGTVCKRAEVEILADDEVRIIITEGKYHQIKRMLGVVGLGVNELHRERIGSLTLPEGLKSGQTVELTAEEAKNVFKNPN